MQVLKWIVIAVVVIIILMIATLPMSAGDINKRYDEASDRHYRELLKGANKNDQDT